MKRLSQEEETQVIPQEVQITPEDRESWFQNSIPLLEKYKVPQEYYPYYRQLANISQSERLYTIQVNSWGKYIGQIKHGLETPQDFEAVQLLRKNPGFNNFPEDRIKDYIRLIQTYPDLYSKYNWSFYDTIIENPSFFQDDNKKKLLNTFLYEGKYHPQSNITDAVNFIERISTYPEIFNYLVTESSEKYEIVKTYLDFCEKYSDQVDFLDVGLRRFKYINVFYDYLNQFSENGSIDFKEAREVFELVGNETSKLTALNIKKIKANLKTPENVETFNKLSRKFFDSNLATPYQRDFREAHDKEDYGFFDNKDQHRDIDALIFLAKTKIGSTAAALPSGPLYVYMHQMTLDALNQLIKIYYFFKNNGNYTDEEIIEKCNNLQLVDPSEGKKVDIKKVISNNEDYQNIILQKSGLSGVKNDDNLDFLKEYYYIFTYLNQNTIHKIIQEITHKLNFTLTSDNVNLIKSQFNLIQPRISDFIKIADEQRTFIPNNFIKEFLNFFFNKYPYDYSNILRSIIQNIDQIPTENFSPQYFDRLVIKYIKSDNKYSRFDDFDGDILDYISMFETGNTYLKKLDLSNEQIENIKQLYDNYSKEIRFPKSTLINISTIQVTRGIDLSGEFARNFKNHDLLDEVSDSVFKSENVNPEDIDFILKQFLNLLTPYFLVVIAKSLEYRRKDFIEQIKSYPLEIILCLLLDGDDLPTFEVNDSQAREYIDKFERQYRNIHKNTKEYFAVLCYVITYKNLFGLPSNLIITGINNDISKDGDFDTIEQSSDAYSFLLLVFGNNINNWLRKFNNPHDAVQGFDSSNFNWPRSEKEFGDYLLKATTGYKDLSNFPTQKIAMIQNFWFELTEDEKKLTFNQLYSICDVKNFKIVNSKYDVKSDEFASQYMNSALKEGFEPLQEHYLKSLTVPLPKWSNVVLTKGNLTARFLPRSDARGMFLGKHSDCCQSPGDAAEGAALFGQIEPNSAFFVVENKKGQIVAQSWVWEDEWKKIIVFDNIEGKGLGYLDTDSEEVRQQKTKRQKQIFELYTAFSTMMPDEYSVYVGGGYSKVDMDELVSEDKVEEEFDYKAIIPRKNYSLYENRVITDDDGIYSDATKQFRILKNVTAS